MAEKGFTYAEAGVDIDAGNRMVELIKPLVRATARAGADAEIGGFGGLFDLKRAGFSDPVLVAATDGVGTKLMIAIEIGAHETIGIDLVAMSVNDLVVQGALPLFFLDYFACGKLAPEIGARVVKGVAEGCRIAGCALIGGETAEMPDLYRRGDYDLAGFAVGAAERHIDRHDHRLVGERIEIGAKLGRHAEALGEKAVDRVADAGCQEQQEGNPHLAGGDRPNQDRHQQNAGKRDKVRYAQICAPPGADGPAPTLLFPRFRVYPISSIAAIEPLHSARFGST